MKQRSYFPQLSRRTTLQWIGAASLASTLPWWTEAVTQPNTGTDPIPQGYGTDPDLKNPVVPWPLVMEPQHLLLSAALADLILPATATAPAPSTIGIADFMNEWISAPYPEQRRDRTTILEGLRWLDAQAERHAHRGFLDLDAHSRSQIVDDIARKSPASAFFLRFRLLVVAAYYTTPEGLEDIGYAGNVPLASYLPVTEEERQILDQALAQLGLLDKSKESHS